MRAPYRVFHEARPYPLSKLGVEKLHWLLKGPVPERLFSESLARKLIHEGLALVTMQVAASAQFGKRSVRHLCITSAGRKRLASIGSPADA